MVLVASVALERQRRLAVTETQAAAADFQQQALPTQIQIQTHSSLPLH